MNRRRANPAEPTALISKASTPMQRVLVTTLSAVAAEAARHGIEPPTLLVVGQVVRLRAGLDWLGALNGQVLEPDPLGTRHRGETG